MLEEEVGVTEYLLARKMGAGPESMRHWRVQQPTGPHIESSYQSEEVHQSETSMEMFSSKHVKKNNNNNKQTNKMC